MTLTIKNLGNGQLPSSKGTLYTVPALTQAIVVLIDLVNTDVASRNVNIYYKKATSRNISGKDIPLDASGRFLVRGPFTMDAGDLIEGDASAATVVDYTIHGVENA